jgi:hypothetical protein
MSGLLAWWASALAVGLCVAIGGGGAAAQTVKPYQPAPVDPAKPAPQEGETGKTAAPAAPRKRPVPPAPGAEAAAERGVVSLQCDWLGKRIISLLVRDDPDAAQDFTPFYQRFACAEDHLSKAFGCAVANLDDVENNGLAELVDACWKNPAVRMVAAEPETAGDKPEKPLKTDKPEKGGKGEGAPGRPAESPPKPQ